MEDGLRRTPQGEGEIEDGLRRAREKGRTDTPEGERGERVRVLPEADRFRGKGTGY
jgi:hypothetical protein